MFVSAADQVEVLSSIQEDLLEDHDADHVELELLEVLVEEDDDEVGNVSVYELKHVDFVDQRVLCRLHVPMILESHQFRANLLVDVAEEEDQGSIDSSR